MDLVIAEKPKCAISIAKVIGDYKKKNGFYEGSGYKGIMVQLGQLSSDGH